ncbi:putative nucleotide-diphospho-sugar transferase [Bacillus safensis]|uniref:putative nucleotide-diphospho-sugar transferase n=1 Tax=Bacillus safensis TaxID=561879 RepID=UPI002280DBE6|nr:putative nucleotide-diphospho-sugar transferase [Bacillus safensis]MCY7674821.1 putative nucleotide-diphospho-sugar transferase [Bacillus safensis]MCY7697372.1 putative nucleotide-diphospho-sugar transferase [Bacillus safensis]MEC3627999.1 putative nucleotide-diphospho-sugar transferase [Bacillus safensis]
MASYHFTTIVSNTHVFKLLALIHSLEQNAHSFKLSVLCADPLAYKVLKEFPHPHVQYEQLEDIEDDTLRKAKEDRTFHEYCWTLKPAYLLNILESSDADYLAHLDTDLYFYHDPEAIFAENPSAHLFLTDHMNSKRFYRYYELSGRFNTGFVGCRNTDVAKQAVTQWKENCVAHCTVEMDTEKKTYGDQRYVERWVDDFEGVHIVASKGANAAIWNIENYKLSVVKGDMYLDECPLLFYHFSAFTIIDENTFNLNWYYYMKEQKLVDHLYIPYADLVHQKIKQVQKVFPEFKQGFIAKKHVPDTHFYER